MNYTQYEQSVEAGAEASCLQALICSGHLPKTATFADVATLLVSLGETCDTCPVFLKCPITTSEETTMPLPLELDKRQAVILFTTVIYRIAVINHRLQKEQRIANTREFQALERTRRAHRLIIELIPRLRSVTLEHQDDQWIVEDTLGQFIETRGTPAAAIAALTTHLGGLK